MNVLIPKLDAGAWVYDMPNVNVSWAKVSLDGFSSGAASPVLPLGEPPLGQRGATVLRR